jgi:CRISPR/Cas system type I-B associated protein Csh2 (Cas7 group RAMP superfamily)
MCPNCTYVLDPRAAYEAGDIDVEDVSLKRLAREVLKEMGISELVEETIEERNKRNRKEATEKRKEAKSGK